MMDASPLLAKALAAASDTKFLEVGPGVLARTPEVFQRAFGHEAEAIVIGDPNTMQVAGNRVAKALTGAGVKCREPFVLADPELSAEFRFVESLDGALAGHAAIPVVVASGSLNDLVKLSAHRMNRPYLVVATAASMDGYTAFGASITRNGSKQTFDCPAPRAVVADLDVIRRAPAEMNASGYADLTAKITAGADWITADLLGVEPIDPTAWELVQPPLRQWTENAQGIRTGDPDAIRGLVEGLLMTGFAMQWSKTSRPASGAEHQFSHLWDMQHHTHNQFPPSHGFKVGIGTLAVTYLYEYMLGQDFQALDIDRLTTQWPGEQEAVREARNAFDIEELGDKAALETKAKYISAGELKNHLERLKQQERPLKARLRGQLAGSGELKRRMSEAGAPTEPEQIGISRNRLRDSFRQACFIRRRYTALDLAIRTGMLERALAWIFGPDGPWPIQVSQPLPSSPDPVP